MTDPDAYKDRIVELADGNPGAVTVLANILKTQGTDEEQVFDALAELNMRGPRIWLGYKDYSGKDLDAFIENVMARDEDMIALINERSAPDAPSVGTQ